MIHHRRRFRVVDVASVEALVDQLHGRSHLGCAGFWTPGGLLWLNDAFSEDGAQEFAVFVPGPDGTCKQIESITVSWLSRADLAATVARLETAVAHTVYATHVLTIQTAAEHGGCGACR